MCNYINLLRFISITSIALFGVSNISCAAEIVETQQVFSLELGATRVIYNPSTSGATLSVSNPQDYPILVQSRIYKENKKDPAPFILTPPLFRLDAHQRNKIRVIQDGSELKKDRESLFWMCVTGIPPKTDDIWAKENSNPTAMTLATQVRVSNCIKIFVRPNKLKGNSLDAASALIWKGVGSKTLKVSNPSSFYVSLKKIQIGNVELKSSEPIPPFGSVDIKLASDYSNALSQVNWTVVTDAGGESRKYSSTLQ